MGWLSMLRFARRTRTRSPFFTTSGAVPGHARLLNVNVLKSVITAGFGRDVPGAHEIALRPEREVPIEAGPDETELLLLQGRPIGEPVVAYGPFVMNTRAEIQQTFADYQRTQFGGWPWPSSEPVHPRNEGRFARHADGRTERPD